MSAINSRPTATSSAGSTPTAGSTSSNESSSESNSEGESEYSSESDDESRDDEPTPLPKSRPDDPEKGIEYDITKAVWAKRSVALSGAAIRSALSEAWEIFKGIRDKWKADMAQLQQAEEQKDKERALQYKNLVEGRRRLLESCIRLTLKHGHNDIVERLGENPSMSAVLSSFLIDRTKENEYAGRLITSILELMVRWLKVDQGTLEKTKLDKLLPKLVKKGDEKVKLLAQKVLDTSGIVSNKQLSNGKPASSQSIKNPAITASAGEASRQAEGTSNLKRPKPNDPASISPNKKQVGSDGAITVSNKAIPKPVSGLEKRRQQAAKADTKSGSKATLSAPVIEKVKTNHIAAKPSAFFSSLQSASKKPGTAKTSASLLKGKDGKDIAASDAKGSIPAGAGSKPAFSFAETIANLSKAKNDVPSKSEEVRPPETDEEKRKRLRKEQRRKMRVSFKADDELEEIRTFVHDPEEELGHDDSMVRDVGDSRGEGQMLKMHKDLELMDDEEEDYEPTEEVPVVWHEPTLIDFTVMKLDQRERNIVTRGGMVQISSQEKIVQEKREAGTLAVTYSSLAATPTSPTEPTEQHAGVSITEKAFWPPGEETKAREAQYYASRTAPSPGSAVGKPPAFDISALLRNINNHQQPQPPSQQPASQPTQAQQSGLEAIFAQFANTGNGQQPPQAQMQPMMQQPPAPPGYNVQAALAAMNVNNPAQTAFVPPATNQQPNLQSILAQFGQQPAPQMQGYGYTNSYQTDNDRKRQANFEDHSNLDHGYAKGKRQKGEEKKFFNPPRFRDPCKFWLEGKCSKGEACTFLHTERPAG